jgi:hypothetical protein
VKEEPNMSRGDTNSIMDVSPLAGMEDEKVLKKIEDSEETKHILKQEVKF